MLSLTAQNDELGAAVSSRSRAVGRIIGGSVTSVLGAALVVGAEWLGSGSVSLGLAIGGLGLLGAGLGLMGRAVSHLSRFGYARPTLILGGTLGLGASVMVYAVSLLPAAFGVLPWLSPLNFPAAVSVMGFAAFIALLFIGSFVKWWFNSGSEWE